jgi:hypothetical protein
VPDLLTIGPFESLGSGETIGRHEFRTKHRNLTNGYLGCKQRLKNAVNDLIGLEPERP